MASASKDTARMVTHALTLAQKVVDADTEVSTTDLALLSNLNTNQFLNYIKLDQQLGALEKESQKMVAAKAEVASLLADLDHIEKQVDALAAVVEELDAWCSELEST